MLSSSWDGVEAGLLFASICPLMYWDFMSNISSDPDRFYIVQSATNIGVFSSSYSN
jgi:hypothetical protein